MKPTTLVTVFILCLSISCNSHIKKLSKSTLDNKFDLNKVILHYKETGEKEKQKAAEFIISNIGDKGWYDGKIIKQYDTLFYFLDSIQRHKTVNNQSPEVKSFWNELEQKYGVLGEEEVAEFRDSKELNANFFIQDIDLAFKIKEENNWSKNLPLEQFCNYVLPYRIGNERPEFWRSNLYDSYSKVRKKSKATTMIDFASSIQYEIRRRVGTSATLWSYPYDIPASKMEKGRKGACRHLVCYNTMAMRANGIPVTSDFTPLWANSYTGHKWNVLLSEDGKFIPFDAAHYPLSFNLTDRKVSKIFRENFAKVNINVPATNEVPANLYDDHWSDVTSEYVKTHDVSIEIANLPEGEDKKYGLICTFNNTNWEPAYWGKRDSNFITFKNMGTDAIYTIAYLNKGYLQILSNPFILRSNGEINYLQPDGSKMTMYLTRKYPQTSMMDYFMGNMKSGVFQGANNPDFSDSVTLFKIDTIPIKVETVQLTLDKSYRYFRYLSASNDQSYVAEIEVWGGNNNKPVKLLGTIIGSGQDKENQKAFDSNLETYFWGGKRAWVGIDFGTPQNIYKISYCPRSDTNFILLGDLYELCYWKNGSWVSLGKQTAVEQYLTYSNVPKGSLYILHDLTKGKEERIFTYENGKQIWW